MDSPVPAPAPSPEPGIGPGAVGEAQPAGRRLALLTARIVALAAGAAAAAIVLAREWPQVSGRLGRLSPAPAVGALAAVLLALVAGLLSWRRLLAGAGHRLGLAPAARIFFVSALGKYVPGSVWPYLAQVEMGRRYDVPRIRSAAVSVLAVAVSLLSGLAVAAATLPWSSPATARRYWFAFLAVPFLVAGLHPAVLRGVLARAGRWLRRPATPPPLGWATVATSALWAVVAWLAYGAQTWFFAHSVAGLQPSRLPLAVGVYALAWAAGFLAVVAPAGAGVREAALTAGLATVMPASAALTVALLSRAATTAGDLLLAGVSWRLGRQEPRTASM